MRMQKIALHVMFFLGLAACSEAMQSSESKNQLPAGVNLPGKLNVTISSSDEHFEVALSAAGISSTKSVRGAAWNVLPASAGFDAQLKLDFLKNTAYRRVGEAALSPDGERIAVAAVPQSAIGAGASTHILIINLTDSKVTSVSQLNAPAITSLAWSPDSTTLAILEAQAGSKFALGDVFAQIGGHPITYVDFDLLLLSKNGTKVAEIRIANVVRMGFGGLKWE